MRNKVHNLVSKYTMTVGKTKTIEELARLENKLVDELEPLFYLNCVVSSCADKEKQAYDDGFEHGCTVTANDLGSRF